MYTQLVETLLGLISVGAIAASDLSSINKLNQMIYLLLFIAILFLLSLTAAILLARSRSISPADNDNSNIIDISCIPKPRWKLKTNSSTKQNENGNNNNNSNKPVVIMLSYGTRGDVQPLIALAQSLNSKGIRAIVCTTDNFKSFVEDNDVEFISCGVSDVDQPDSLFDPIASSDFASVIHVLQTVYKPLCIGMHKACVDTNPCLIISQAVVRSIGAHIAESLGIESWSAHFAPSNIPTDEFPPSDSSPSNIPMLNKLKYHIRSIKIIIAAVKSGLAEDDKFFREKVLSLSQVPLGDAAKDIENEPSLHAYSTVLQRKPKDWPKWAFLTGSWNLREKSNVNGHKINDDVISFLNNNKPIFLSFGSMKGVDNLLVSSISAISAFANKHENDSTKKTSVIIVIPFDDKRDEMKSLCSKNYSNLNILFLKSIPHPIVFPKCSVVIHHGGAGTTMASILAGVPSIIIPVLAWSDQTFWGRVIEEQGLGKCVNRFVHKELLSNAKLLEREIEKDLEHCVLDKYLSDFIQKFGAQMRDQPEGSEIAADIIQQHVNKLLSQ